MPYCSVTAFRSDSTSSISNIDLVRMYLLVDKKQVGSCLFPSNALLWSLCSGTTWVGSCVSGCPRVENTRDVAAAA